MAIMYSVQKILKEAAEPRELIENVPQTRHVQVMSPLLI